MTLKLVADAIDMHESTVSRVTSNKYVATPRGLFEMKYFFTTALGSSTGEADHSAEAVRHRIRQLIEAEAADDILSDDTIAEMLQSEQGIEVARRTVAKYREAMNIPSSVIRRRQKKALLARRLITAQLNGTALSALPLRAPGSRLLQARPVRAARRAGRT